MSKKELIIAIVIVILSVGLGIIISKSYDKYENNYNYEKIKLTLDSIHNRLDSLENRKQIIITKIDSSKQKVKIIEKWYEKEYNNMLVQPTDSDYVFFKDYLSQ